MDNEQGPEVRDRRTARGHEDGGEAKEYSGKPMLIGRTPNPSVDQVVPGRGGLTNPPRYVTVRASEGAVRPGGH